MSPVARPARAAATTSPVVAGFPETLDSAVRMPGIFNRELQHRNAPETSRWCASLMNSAPLGELARGPIGRAPKMAGKEAGVSGTDMKLRPRLADVAQQAGVSPATASRVLTGSARVRPETRREVEEAIARLGYVRNRAPRAAAPRRTGSIAFVVCEDNSRVFSEPFFPLMLRSISRELSARGIQLVLLMAHSPRDYQIASRYLRSGHVDGAVLVSMHGKRPLDLHSLGVPVVLAGRPFGNDDDLSYVDADNIGGARMAVRYLLSHGRSTVATVAGPPDMSPGVDRLAEAGLSDSGLIVFGDFGRVSAEHAVYRLLDRRPALDAVFVASDLMAAGALRALRRSGRRVPDDVAVIGFEDSPLARHTDPKLTTVRQPVEAMGERLASELLALIGRAGQDPAHVVLDTELVIRESA
jgi:DNA-binding LacI/PurR family transcriptional regulator